MILSSERAFDGEKEAKIKEMKVRHVQFKNGGQSVTGDDEIKSKIAKIYKHLRH